LQQLLIVPYRTGFSQGFRERDEVAFSASLDVPNGDRCCGEKNEAEEAITKRFRRMKILLVEQQKNVGTAKRFRFFTTDGATKYFSKLRLEKRLEIRATIEPDSQDVFCRSSSSALCLM
jgi:hypothetical protein